jgi:hypothetical protein
VASGGELAGIFSDQRENALAGYEAMAMIRRGQVWNIGGNDIRAQAEFTAGLFKVAA